MRTSSKRRSLLDLTFHVRNIAFHLPPQLTLARQFIIMGLLVVTGGMLAIGLWVTSHIETALVQERAGETALFVDSIVSPLVQELGQSSVLSEQSQRRLLDMIQKGPLAKELFSFKIWRPDGTVVFSSDPNLIGQHFAPGQGLKAALAGQVDASFTTLSGQEHSLERKSGYPLIEVYSPIHETGTGKIIGVAELYEFSADILAELQKVLFQSWLVVAAVTICMLMLLYGIVARGSVQIERQKRALDDQVEELANMVTANIALRQHIDAASQNAAALNERYLRRISAELHDGPAQMLGFATMRLKATEQGKAREDDHNLIQRAVADALQEIRNICRGLRLPELEELSADEVVKRAIQSHEFYSGSHINADLARIGVQSVAEKICIYRFLQETLSNAARHAQASRVDVITRQKDGYTAITVKDDGIGFSPDASTVGLGLVGLRERVASLGGTMEVHMQPEGGASVHMRLKMREKR
ncbi:signal transduction histidine kinase [Agrobacterium larrymoorei]|uniref:histidine kinase n=1 Tax=Agrobacterium larrymoorei TaxID=160699 RepID=A0ABU0UFK1_9HYPH|nr:signal transduction histidine kinase [Agrobacterium larrymoorei]